MTFTSPSPAIRALVIHISSLQMSTGRQKPNNPGLLRKFLNLIYFPDEGGGGRGWRGGRWSQYEPPRSGPAAGYREQETLASPRPLGLALSLSLFFNVPSSKLSALLRTNQRLYFTNATVSRLRGGRRDNEGRAGDVKQTGRNG